MKRISILIPAYNEEAVLPELFERLTEFMDEPDGLGSKYDFEVLLVNDGSRDATLRMLEEQYRKDQRFSHVSLSRNFGKENAMLAGLDNVTGDCCVIMDADLQDPLDVIPLMVEEWENGYDDIYGKRTTRGKESWLRKKLTLTYYRMLQSMTKVDILPNVGDFRLLDRRCIDKLRQMRETQRYTKGLYAWIGYNKKKIEFERADRVGGKSSFNFLRLFNLAIEGITCFTTAPLRIATVIGLIVALLSMVYLIWVIAKTLIWGEPVQGFPTIMCAILFLGAIQLIAIGIIGEYIGRIFNETKGRPPYIIASKNGQRV